jgi:peroxiredoxin
MKGNPKLGLTARVALLAVTATGVFRLSEEPCARATSASASASSVQIARGPRAGDRAPPFALKSVDTSEPKALERLLKEGAPRGVAVVFLSCKCPYTAQARQPLGELFKTFGSKVTFVGINANQNEALDDIKADASLSYPFPMLRDDGAKVADQYGAERTPEVFLIDPAGVIRYHGGVADLGAALGELTKGRPVVKPEAKAFGCTIKRKAS